MARTRRLWAFHYGTENNQFYALYLHRPTVNPPRMVRSTTTGEQVPLYESPDEFLLNICVSGFERLFGAFPLGEVRSLILTREDDTE
jgi:hypothetical protein